MINLGVEKYVIDKIEKNHPNDVDRQKQEAFNKWLRMKPNACWKQIIDALYKMEEVTLAQDLERKYDWRDPRVIFIQSTTGSLIVIWHIQVFVNRCNLLDAAPKALITAEPLIDISIRKFLPPLNHGQEYYKLESGPTGRIIARYAEYIL